MPIWREFHSIAMNFIGLEKIRTKYIESVEQFCSLAMRGHCPLSDSIIWVSCLREFRSPLDINRWTSYQQDTVGLARLQWRLNRVANFMGATHKAAARLFRGRINGEPVKDWFLKFYLFKHLLRFSPSGSCSASTEIASKLPKLKLTFDTARWWIARSKWR